MKPEKLQLQSEVKKSDDTTWKFSLDSPVATFIKKKEDIYSLCPIPDFFENFVISNHLTNIKCLGLISLSPTIIMVVLLASKNHKDDTCIFDQFISQTLKHSLSLVTASLKITKVKVTNERLKDVIGLILYLEDEEKGYKTHIVFDAKKGLPLVEKKLKTWDLQK